MNMQLLKDVAEKYPDDILHPFGKLLDRIGFEAFCAVVDEFGGSSIYVPSIKTIFCGCVARQMQLDYNGINIRQLCKDYGLCEASVRRIINKYCV